MTLPTEQATAGRLGCLAYLGFGFALLWMAIIALVAVSGVGVLDVLFAIGNEVPWFADMALTAGLALLVLVVIGPLATFSRALPLKASYQIWLRGAATLLLLAFTRLFPLWWDNALLLVQALLLAGMAYIWRNQDRRPPAPRLNNSNLWAVALAFLLLLPWLAVGALGAPFDILVALLTALAAGWFVASTWASEAPFERPLWQDGLTLGGLLLLLACGLGAERSTLLTLAALPALGFALAALARLAQQRHEATASSIAVPVSAVSFTALALFDPNELNIILGPGDILGLAGIAASLALLLALFLSIGLAVLAWIRLKQAPTTYPAQRSFAAGSAFVALGLALAIYVGVGNPGFYGDRLFVVLSAQADLQTIQPEQPRDARLQATYTNLVGYANDTQAELRELFTTLGRPFQPYYLVNAIEVDGDPLLHAYLLTRSDVDRVLVSPRLRPLNAPPPPEIGELSAPKGPVWSIIAIEANRVWDELGVTGEGIVVGQSDSGVDGLHPALAAGYRGTNGNDDYNWLDPWYGSLQPRDYGSHGTHTLGSAVGRNGIGVAPGASWFGCVNLARNLANPALYLDCLQFMLAPWPRGGDPLRDGDPTRAAHVINNSWGCPPEEGCDATVLQPAVEALRRAGIFVVVSAGNSGPVCNSVNDPLAIYDAVLSIGSVDAAGDLSDFSSRGPVTIDGSLRTKPDLLAPGDGVLSATPGASYAINSGTSMAGPHVAGVVALMWSANPALIGDIDRTEALLLSTAKPYEGLAAVGCAAGNSDSAPSNSTGAGIVNAYAAVQAARAAGR
jgi:subtilisin family serine protease